MKNKSWLRLSQLLILVQCILVPVLASAFMYNQKLSAGLKWEGNEYQLGVAVAVAVIFNIAYQHKSFMKLGTV